MSTIDTGESQRTEKNHLQVKSTLETHVMRFCKFTQIPPLLLFISTLTSQFLKKQSKTKTNIIEV